MASELRCILGTRVVSVGACRMVGVPQSAEGQEVDWPAGRAKSRRTEGICAWCSSKVVYTPTVVWNLDAECNVKTQPNFAALAWLLQMTRWLRCFWE